MFLRGRIRGHGEENTRNYCREMPYLRAITGLYRY